MTLPGKIDLNDLVVFNAVAQAGGFSAAAQRLAVAPAKVSVEIGRLEAQLGAALFTRTTRKVALTEAGKALHADVLPLLEKLLSAVDNVQTPALALTGTLRIATSVDHVEQSLGPALLQFAALHPALQIDVRTSDRVSDLVGEGIDLAIRMGWLRDSSLRAVKLGEFAQYVVTSPAYLKRIAAPHTPADLPALDWVALTLLPTPLTWTFTANGVTQTVHTSGRVKVDSPGALHALIRDGAGVTILAEQTVQADLQAGRLVQLLPGWTLPRGGIYAVFPPGRHRHRNAHAFIAFYQHWRKRAA